MTSGDARALARAITLVENRTPESIRAAEGIVPAHRQGNGPWHDRLARRRQEHAGRSTGACTIASSRKTVGIVAVDPTSPFTGGAILGDRIRMQDRIMPIRAFTFAAWQRADRSADWRAPLPMSLRCSMPPAATVILIETVGVGQDEVDIVRLADVTVVILVPGMGDDVQTIKAGIMEIADIFVINKSDREGAERVEREIRAMQSLAARDDNWTPPIVKTVASAGARRCGTFSRDFELPGVPLAFGAGASKAMVENWRERLLEMLRDAAMQQVLRQHGEDAIAATPPKLRIISATRIL